ALANDYPQGHVMLLLSDGIHNGAGGIQGLREALRSSKAMNVPIHTTTFGTETTLNDLEVLATRPQELAFIGQTVPLTVEVKQRGRIADKVELALFRDDKEVEKQQVTITANGVTTARFDVHEEARGLFRYEVRAAAVAGESTPANN